MVFVSFSLLAVFHGEAMSGWVTPSAGTGPCGFFSPCHGLLAKEIAMNYRSLGPDADFYTDFSQGGS